jgi:predicted esterase
MSLAFVRSPRSDGRWAPGANTEEFIAAVQAATTLVSAGIVDLRARFSPNKVIAVGYSEGAALALALAAKGTVDAALSIAGYLPPSLAPAGQVPSWVYVLSGGQDKTITPAFSEQTAQLFLGKASQVTQQPIAAGTHELGTLIAPARTALDEILVEVV